MNNLPTKLNADLPPSWHRTDINYKVGCSFRARSAWLLGNHNTQHRASLEQTVTWFTMSPKPPLLSHGPACSRLSISSCCPWAWLPYYVPVWTPSDSCLPQTPSLPPQPRLPSSHPCPLLQWHNLEASSPLPISNGLIANKPNPNLPETGLGSSFLDQRSDQKEHAPSRYT